MARVFDLTPGVELGLTLDRYAVLMRIPEPAFNGLNKPGDPVSYYCNKVWRQRDREHLAHYIAMAEELRETEIGHHISEKYIEGEKHDYGFPIITDKGFVTQVGKQKTSVIEEDYEVDYSGGGDTITLETATSVTDESEIHVFYQDEDVEINPSDISIQDGDLTVEIPKARLVKPSLMDNREDPLSYDDDDNYVEYVDIKRVYYDESEGMEFVWLDTGTGDEETQTVRPIVENAELGIIRPYPASYSDGSWALTNLKYTTYPWLVRVNYLSGVMSSTRAELVTIKLAHTLMPFTPIDCESVTQYWQNDNVPTDTHTPYGSTKGAVDAWVADSRFKTGGGGMFA